MISSGGLSQLGRRSVLQAAVGVAGGMGLGLGHPAMAAHNRLVCGTVGGAWLDGIKKIFIEDTGFATKYDAEMVWDVQTDSVLISKALSSCGRPIDDVLQAEPDRAARVAAANCLVDYDEKIVTNLPDIEPEYKSGPYFAATNRLLCGLVYNTKYCTRPTGWNDLANPKYKGKVGIPTISWMGQELLYAVNKSFGGTEENTDPGIAFLAKVVRGNNAVMIASSQPAQDALQREDVWIMPFWLGRMFTMKRSGLPVDIFFPDNFLYADVGYVVPKGPNAELAQRFVNVSLDPVAQQGIFEKFLYQPTNRKTVIRPELREALLPDYAKGHQLKVDWLKISGYADRDVQRWNKEVLGS
jgi:putative spermidine/putrescine transport system substrate-binding protein